MSRLEPIDCTREIRVQNVRKNLIQKNSYYNRSLIHFYFYRQSKNAVRTNIFARKKKLNQPRKLTLIVLFINLISTKTYVYFFIKTWDFSCIVLLIYNLFIFVTHNRIFPCFRKWQQVWSRDKERAIRLPDKNITSW